MSCSLNFVLMCGSGCFFWRVWGVEVANGVSHFVSKQPCWANLRACTVTNLYLGFWHKCTPHRKRYLTLYPNFIQSWWNQIVWRFHTWGCKYLPPPPKKKIQKCVDIFSKNETRFLLAFYQLLSGGKKKTHSVCSEDSSELPLTTQAKLAPPSYNIRTVEMHHVNRPNAPFL